MSLVTFAYLQLRASGVVPGWPGGHSLFFASPKKSKQKKGDPTVCDPKPCFRQPAMWGFDGEPLELASLRQSQFYSRQNTASQAQTEGDENKQLVALRTTLHLQLHCRWHLDLDLRSCLNSRIRLGARLRCNARQRRASSAKSPAVVRRRVAQGWVDQGTRLSEALAEFERHPAQTEQRSEPAPRAGDAFGSPFFWVLFFGEAKKSASPAGARPGQPAQLKPKHKEKHTTGLRPSVRQPTPVREGTNQC